MRNEQASKRVHQGVYFLASGLTYESTRLQSIQIYQKNPYLGEMLGLLLCFQLLCLAVTLCSKDIRSWFCAYLGVQTVLVSLLLIHSNKRKEGEIE
jgi:hypothetical protein